jgi:hypothetical protein
MSAVKITILKYVKDDFPGIVECSLTDAHEKEWVFQEKAPVVSSQDLDSQTSYPQIGEMSCKVISRHKDSVGKEIITIQLDTVERLPLIDVLNDQLVLENSKR